MALFKTSNEAREILEVFRKTGIRPNLWARAALGYSLSLDSPPTNDDLDSEGSEFPDKVFFGDDEDVLLGLLRQRTGRAIAPDEVGRLVKLHVERGIRYFHDEYQRLNRRGDELLLHLVKLSQTGKEVYPESIQELLPRNPETSSFEVRVIIGHMPDTGTAVEHVLNAPGIAPHVAIMGRNGTGKTRTALGLLQNLASHHAVPFLVFDYAKGDIAANVPFVKASKAQVVQLPDETIPLAPLSIPSRDTHSLHLAAHRFRDTICSVVRLGAVQKERCLQLITKLYEDFGDSTPDLQDLASAAEIEYSNNGYRDDSLIACLREFSTFPIFWLASTGTSHDFFRRTHVIDIHQLPEDLRKLSTFLLLDRLYAEIMSLPDAPLDNDGFRQLRLIIIIDEAHHYLPCKNLTLQNMVREVRSKGVGLWFLSQSPDDFDQPQYNFAREMGLSIVFSCVLEKPKMLEAVLGGKIDPKRLSRLAPGVALTRVSTSDAPSEIQTWRP